jgi:serine/threonine protein kinase
LVKKGVHKKTGKEVAVKIVSKKDIKPSDLECLKREIEIMKMCQHPNTITMYDVFENHEYIYMVMEVLKGGDLFTWLEARGFKIKEEKARSICHSLATAIFYLHSFGIAHRDLKPENILMTEEGDNTEVKIVDFGLSKIVGPNETSKDPFGTLSYVAPEVLLQKPYGKEVDIFSLGVIFFMMQGGFLPFDDDNDKEIARKTIYDEPDFAYHTWSDVSIDCKDCIGKMLEKSRTKRI